MSTDPRISIVVPSYNQGIFLAQNIESIIRQSYKNYEIILMDGGSSDTSELIIDQYRDHFSYVRQEKDAGHYAAINEGFALASGEILMWLNSDDMLHPGALHVIARAYRQFGSESGLFTGLPCTWDEAGQLTSININPPQWGENYFLEMNLDTDSFMQQESTFFTHKLWDDIGGLNASRYPYAADFDLWLRMSAQSKIISLPYLIGGFRIHSQQRSHQYERYCFEAQQSKIAFVDQKKEHQEQPDFEKPFQELDWRSNGEERYFLNHRQSITLYTSISPRNTTAQQDSAYNWKRNGFGVASLNSKEEIDTIADRFPGVVFQQTDCTLETQYGKPYVSLSAMVNACANSSHYSGIINSDIRFIAQASAESVLANALLSEESRNTLYLCSRIEISNLCSQSDFDKAGRGLPVIADGNVYTYGFDAIFARTEVWEQLSALIGSHSCYGLGVPWWDYYLPWKALTAGIQLRMIHPPIISHFYHPAQYSEEIWIGVGNTLAREALPQGASRKEYERNLKDFESANAHLYSKLELDSLSRELIKYIHSSAKDFNPGQSITGPDPRLWSYKRLSEDLPGNHHWMTQSPATFHRNYHG